MDWLLVEIPYLDIPVVVVVGVVGLWLLLRNRETAFASTSELEAAIGGGEPLVIDFFGKL